MPDFLTFDAGRAQIADQGLPTDVIFLLSSKAVGSLKRSDTALTVGEIQGLGYTRKPLTRPPVTAGNPSTVNFPMLKWETLEAGDGDVPGWSSPARSVVMLAADQTPICAWNLLAGGGGRDVSKPYTTETFTPTLTLD